jgi:FkbM family methyltransferase
MLENVFLSNRSIDVRAAAAQGRNMRTALQSFAVGALARYVRHFPVDAGKWRLARPSIDLVRKHGPTMGERTIRTKYGFRMKLDLGDWVDQHVFATGEYEPDVIAVVRNSLCAGMTAVDVGANIGFFSLLFAKTVGPTGTVLAFEPQPLVLARLRENIRLNPNLDVEVQAIAASDVVSEIDFFCGPTDHSGIASLRSFAGSSQRISVKTAPLDRILASYPSVNLIKVDVEGAELKAIDGLQDTIRRCQPDLIVEVSNSYLQQMNASAAALCESICRFGYSMFQIGWNGLSIVDRWSESLPAQFNALFTHRPDGFRKCVSTN